jgi:hypothetical protein
VSQGTKAIEGLVLKLQRTSRVCFDTIAFEKMKRLRLLQLVHVQLNGDYECLPKHLRWLSWQAFPLKYTPENFYQKNLVAMELKHSSLKQVWKEPQVHMKRYFLFKINVQLAFYSLILIKNLYFLAVDSGTKDPKSQSF